MMVGFFSVVNVAFATPEVTSSEPIPQSEIDPQEIPQKSCDSCNKTFSEEEQKCRQHKSFSGFVRCRNVVLNYTKICLENCAR